MVEAQDWRGLWARNAHIQEVREKAPENYHTARLVCLNLWLEFDRCRSGPSFRVAENDRSTQTDLFANSIKTIAETLASQGKEGP